MRHVFFEQSDGYGQEASDVLRAMPEALGRADGVNAGVFPKMGEDAQGHASISTVPVNKSVEK
jgi:hypothetical protein